MALHFRLHGGGAGGAEGATLPGPASVLGAGLLGGG